MRRLSFLVLAGLVAAAPQLAPMGGDGELVAMTASSSVAAPKTIEVDVEAETRTETELVIEPVVDDAALAIPPAARACGGEALEVQPVALRAEATPDSARPAPRLGLGTCN